MKSGTQYPKNVTARIIFYFTLDIGVHYLRTRDTQKLLSSTQKCAQL